MDWKDDDTVAADILGYDATKSTDPDTDTDPESEPEPKLNPAFQAPPINYKRPIPKHDGWRVDNFIYINRVVLRISQQELAAKVNVTRQTISRIERDKQEPLVGLAIAIAEALDTDVGKLFKLDPAKSAPWKPDPWISSRKHGRSRENEYKRQRF